jgi:drug/metabolite transporter (DMT)-like permease
MGYTAYMVLLERVSPALASSYAFVNPVIGMTLGATLGGEAISRGEWFAAGVITLGVVLLVLSKRSPAPSR